MDRRQLYSGLLRGVAVGGKFFQLVLAASFLSNDDFVWFGALLGLLGFLLFFIGFDLYTYANREYVLKEFSSSKLRVVASQYSVYLLTHVILIVIIVLVGNSFYLLCLFVLLSEHWAAEVTRFWVFQGNPVFSSALYAVRSVTSVLFVLGFHYAGHSDHQLTVESFLWAWALGNMLAIFVSFSHYNHFLIAIRLFRIKRNWLRKAFRFSFPLLLSALCAKAIFGLDRFVVAFLDSDSLAPFYVLLVSIFGLVNVASDAVYFSFWSPRLIESVRTNRLLRVYRKFSRGVTALSVVSVILCPIVVCLSYLVFPDKTQGGSLWMVAGLMLLVGCYLFSQKYHYALYALGSSSIIFASQFYSLLATLITLIALFFFDSISSGAILYLLVLYCLVNLFYKRAYFQRIIRFEQ